MKVINYILLPIILFANFSFAQVSGNSKIKLNNQIYASIGNKYSGKISKTELLSAMKLQLNDPDSIYKIVSFAVWMGCPGRDTWYCTTPSNELTQCMKDGFNLFTGYRCVIRFENIKCIGLNNDTIAIPPLEFSGISNE